MGLSPIASLLPRCAAAIIGLGLLTAGMSARALDGEMNANDPVSTVRDYVDAFNKGDVERMVADFASPGFILDGMSPHVWQGPNAARDWYQDGLIEAQSHHVTEHLISIGEPSHDDVTGNYAYVVVPASFSYKMGGTLIKQTGADFTVALRQDKGSWRIVSWAWTKGTTH